jgi:hypothetical protein
MRGGRILPERPVVKVAQMKEAIPQGLKRLRKKAKYRTKTAHKAFRG